MPALKAIFLARWYALLVFLWRNVVLYPPEGLPLEDFFFFAFALDLHLGAGCAGAFAAFLDFDLAGRFFLGVTCVSSGAFISLGSLTSEVALWLLHSNASASVCKS